MHTGFDGDTKRNHNEVLIIYGKITQKWILKNLGKEGMNWTDVAQDMG
jgi:hypothetical protein